VNFANRYMQSPIHHLPVCNVHMSTLFSRMKFSAMFQCRLVPWPPFTTTENFTKIVPGEPLHRWG